MSPDDITIIPNFSQIKFGQIRILENGPNWQYRNVFNLGEIWNNGYVFRTHSYNWLYLLLIWQFSGLAGCHMATFDLAIYQVEWL